MKKWRFVLLLYLILITAYLIAQYRKTRHIYHDVYTITQMAELRNIVEKYKKKFGHYPRHGPLNFKGCCDREIIYLRFYDKNGKEHYALISEGHDKVFNSTLWAKILGEIMEGKSPKSFRVPYWEVPDIMNVDGYFVLGYGLK